MIRKIAAIVTALASPAAFGAITVPETPREFRGVWVATVTNIDWPNNRTQTVTQMQTTFRAILDRAVALRLNAVVFQVRPGCDALYSSTREPWSRWLTNSEGTAPPGGFDPLTFAVNEAHARGLELHAWVNPYRASRTVYTHAASHISNTRPDLVVAFGSDLWLDPGKADAQTFTNDTVVDIVTRYDVDAIHIDDYFYPYGITSSNPFPDSATFAAYQNGGGQLTLGDWRRNNVNTLVERLNNSIHAAKPWVKFGISPFGIWRPNNPPGTTGLDSYNEIFADSRRWIQSGWCDYLAPQIYWKMDTAGHSYPSLCDWWASPTQNPMGRHIWPGLFTGQIGFGSTPYWDPQTIADEVAYTQDHAMASGNIHFSERVFRANSQGINGILTSQVYQEDRIPPATTWLDSVPPNTPALTTTVTPAGSVTMNWAAPAGEAPFWYVVKVLRGDTWTFDVLTRTTLTSTIPAPRADAVAVVAVDRSGNESAPAVEDFTDAHGLLIH